MLIEPAIVGDLAAIRALLTQTDLPSTDLDAAHLAHFCVVRAPDSTVLLGVAGLEAYPPVGLLRSLAVAPESRGAGIGAVLVEALEALARRLGIGQLALLTTTAERFFAKHGYSVIARGAAPAVLQTTREFAELCPASSTCMQKNIRR